MITVKGKADADWAIISHIIDLGAPNVEFENITFDCKTIKDASGHIFARQKAGEWVEQESDNIEKIYLCSNCENYEAWGETEKTPYCPNCGAKMERRENDGR